MAHHCYQSDNMNHYTMQNSTWSIDYTIRIFPFLLKSGIRFKPSRLFYFLATVSIVVSEWWFQINFLCFHHICWKPKTLKTGRNQVSEGDWIIRERRFNIEKCLGRQEGIGSSVLCLKEVMATSSPNILQSLWQETDIIRGFTGLVHFGFRSRLDISCLAADISVKFQELLSFAESLSGCLRVSAWWSAFPIPVHSRHLNVHNTLCPDLASKGRT